VDLDQVKRSLMERLATIAERVERIGSHLRDPGSKDWEERAIELENEEVLERLEAAERREVSDIRAALRRIADGSYARCATCGGPIADGRLRALPYTSVCVGCAR